MSLPRALLILFLALPFTIRAQERRAPRPNPMAREDVQRGLAQYRQACSMCHGSEAKGAIGPDLTASSLVRHDEAGNLIGPLLREGRIPRGMPAFPNLSAPQVADIVSFLHAAVDVADNRGSGGPARGYSLKRILTGNPDAGKQFFNGPGKCASCHSATGDLKGVARRYTPLELEGRLLYPSGARETAVVSMSSGEKVTGKLLHHDPFFVSLLDGQGNYRSWLLRPGIEVVVEDRLRAHRDLLDHYLDKDIHDVFAYLETLQ